jgi:toxin ParE1/3/4
MNKYRIRYTEIAVEDLDLIFDYISADNRVAAQKMFERLKTSIERLSDMPQLGAVLPTNDLSLVERGYRYLVIDPYIVFYRIPDQEVRVGRVLHSRQDWLNTLCEMNF